MKHPAPPEPEGHRDTGWWCRAGGKAGTSLSTSGAGAVPQPRGGDKGAATTLRWPHAASPKCATNW